MLHFLKENSYTIVKCLVNQLAMTMFGMMLCLATQKHETLLLISSLMAVALYLFLAYYMFWEIGGKDRIAEDGGRRRPTPWRGAAVAAIANIPNLILAILVLATYSSAATVTTAANVYFIANILARGLQGMYLGLIVLFSPNNPIAFLLICLPIPVVAAVGYALGHRNFRILGLFGIKQNVKDETR